MQTTGVPPQLPFWQASVWVQAFPSLQAVPLGLLGLEHTPVAGLQTPASWHWSCAWHTTGLEPVQAPAWQVSVWVQELPSLHAVPLGAFEWVHLASTHASAVQALPSLQPAS